MRSQVSRTKPFPDIVLEKRSESTPRASTGQRKRIVEVVVSRQRRPSPLAPG